LPELKDALQDYFRWAKGSGGIADLLGQCNKDEMPEFVVSTIRAIQEIVEADRNSKSKDVSEGENRDSSTNLGNFVELKEE
jgi:hypothetical protein